VKFANPRNDAALSHSSEPLHARRTTNATRYCAVARQRDESEVKLNGAAELFMRRPSIADADHAEDTGEFHGTPTYAPSSSRRLRATRV